MDFYELPEEATYCTGKKVPGKDAHVAGTADSHTEYVATGERIQHTSTPGRNSRAPISIILHLLVARDGSPNWPYAAFLELSGGDASRPSSKAKIENCSCTIRCGPVKKRGESNPESMLGPEAPIEF